MYGSSIYCKLFVVDAVEHVSCGKRIFYYCRVCPWAHIISKSPLSGSNGPCRLTYYTSQSVILPFYNVALGLEHLCDRNPWYRFNLSMWGVWNIMLADSNNPFADFPCHAIIYLSDIGLRPWYLGDVSRFVGPIVGI